MKSGGNFKGLKLRATVCQALIDEDGLSRRLRRTHSCGGVGLSAFCPKEVIEALIRAAGVAGCVCCTSSGKLSLSKALGRCLSPFCFFGPSLGFAPFTRLVSGVVRWSVLGVSVRGIPYSDELKVYSSVLVGINPWASACWQSDWSPNARGANSPEAGISL